ncbi:hypothetical protein FIBSPDRAFT_874141 [Athelia psychrophila]|uniref:Uncharacterized protein n=1 Tax=Athelia psychrophila TaxID=1759441 RepID=A0A165XTH8_9AGAM|nr:hypothetical protein FIBSPDRAFT_874141 [Fibularhizoctonia sp. CBS 109695]
MGLFHVYVKSVPHGYTITIAFVSHEVADEWWRAMSTHPELSKCITRISPQLYVWTKSLRNELLLQNALYDPHKDGLPQFADKMVYLGRDSNTNTYEPMNGPLGVIPVQYAPDLASGNSFFIRSKVEPYDYWYCHSMQAGQTVYTSREERTPFVVSLANTRVAQGTIMIGTDEVIICPAVAPNMPLDCAGEGVRLAGKGTGKSVKLSDVRTKFVGGQRSELGSLAVKPLVATVGWGKYGNWELV